MTTNFKAIVENCYQTGQNTYTSFRKVPAIASTVGTWVDLSMAPGNPRPNYYAYDALTATRLDSRYGLWHGGSVTPKTKFLHKVWMGSNSTNFVPATVMLLDWLLVYPLVDMDSTEQQDMDNTVTLPRYTDGVGVQMIFVATNPYIGGQIFNVTYTNQAGVTGRTTLNVTSNIIGTIATLVNTSATATGKGPFLPLAQSDYGVRAIESITWQGSNGGLAALALVKPIATFHVKESGVVAEYDFLKQKQQLPIIQDGAYLGFIAAPAGSVAAVPIYGGMTTIWT